MNESIRATSSRLAIEIVFLVICLQLTPTRSQVSQKMALMSKDSFLNWYLGYS